MRRQIVAAFLIGCLLGAVAGSRCQRWAFHRFWQHGPDTQHVLRKFTRELKLDAKQQEAVETILEKQHEKIMALHQEMAAKFNELRASLRKEIKPLLTPEQKIKFEAIAARWDSRHKTDGDAPPEK